MEDVIIGIPNPDEYPDWKPKKQPKEFTREELSKLEQRAFSLGLIARNSMWAKAYERLGDAANILDAFIARSEKTEK